MSIFYCKGDFLADRVSFQGSWGNVKGATKCLLGACQSFFVPESASRGPGKVTWVPVSRFRLPGDTFCVPRISARVPEKVF